MFFSPKAELLITGGFQTYASMVCIVGSSIVPLALSCLCIRFRLSVVLLPIVFMKAFMIGFCQFALLCFFGGAGWLIKTIFMFSGTVNAVLLLYYCSRYSNQAGQWHIKPFLITLAAMLSACLLNRYLYFLVL
jgi:hypothetical protein